MLDAKDSSNESSNGWLHNIQKRLKWRWGTGIHRNERCVKRWNQVI